MGLGGGKSLSLSSEWLLFESMSLLHAEWLNVVVASRAFPAGVHLLTCTTTRAASALKRILCGIKA